MQTRYLKQLLVHKNILDKTRYKKFSDKEEDIFTDMGHWTLGKI